ncbi:MAG: ABC transporter ATP-binding protein [Acholeplasmatales bacterium]|nr:ABC transporter ATP-binding protein [Acholeplasmatales bacterium]
MEVKLIGLTKEFESRGKKKKGQPKEKVVAVDHINIDIPDGKLIGLLGPSGCGKSTTLYMIAGLHKPTDGKILFGDRDVTNLPPEKRGIGLVFQNYALYPHLNVEENICFPLIARKEPKDLAKKKALEMAKLVGIEDYMERKPAELSGGQQQRVAIARALVKKPEVLLLDEPLSNLDARLRLSTREEIRRIQRETGITTIFVTHDQEEAMSISDEIVVMSQGVVQQIGVPQDVYNEPDNEFVAKFLGTPPINIIPAQFYLDKEKETEEVNENTTEAEEVLSENDEATEDNTPVENEESDVEKTEASEKEEDSKSNAKPIVLFGEQEFLGDFDSIGLSNGEEIHIGMRPEFFDITPDGEYEMYVDHIEYIGRDKTVIFTLPGIEGRFKCIVPSETEVNAEEVCKFNLTRYFVFASDGRRLK